MLEEAVMCVHVCGSGHDGIANASHYLYELRHAQSSQTQRAWEVKKTPFLKLPHAFGLKLVQYLEELKSLK